MPRGNGNDMSMSFMGDEHRESDGNFLRNPAIKGNYKTSRAKTNAQMQQRPATKAAHYLRQDTAANEQEMGMGDFVPATVPVDDVSTFVKVFHEFLGCCLVLFARGLIMGPREGVTLPVDIRPFVAGGINMVLVYAGGHISGGHYNPAVTLAVLIRTNIPWTNAIMYMVVC